MLQLKADRICKKVKLAGFYYCLVADKPKNKDLQSSLTTFKEEKRHMVRENGFFFLMFCFNRNDRKQIKSN